MTSPLVSIIIPVYNTEKYISRCLDSVISQTLCDIEIIVIDDGSTDGSCEILDLYRKQDSRIVIVSSENSGVFSARRIGLNAAKGNYVAFIDSDDWVEPDYLERMYVQIGDADLVSTKYYMELGKSNEAIWGDDFAPGVYCDILRNESFIGRVIYDSKKHKYRPFFCGLWNKLYQRDKLIEVYSCMDVDLKIHEDALIVYKYLFSCKDIIISDYAGYHYCCNEGSAYHSFQDSWIRDAGQFYLSMLSVIEGMDCKDLIKEQLQHFVTLSACGGINTHMWSNEAIWIPQYIFDLSDVKGKRIALYGAGRAGQDVYRQMVGLGYDVVSWCDRNYMDYEYAPMRVWPPEHLCDESYDVVFLAASTDALAKSMRGSLVSIGIDDEKILWTKPMTTHG